MESANLRADLGQVCELLWQWWLMVSSKDLGRCWFSEVDMLLTSCCWDTATWLPYLLAREGESLWFDDQAWELGSLLSSASPQLKSSEQRSIWKRAVHYKGSRRKLNAFGGSKSPWFAGRLYGRSKIDLWGALTAKRSRRATWKCKTAIDCDRLSKPKAIPTFPV